MKRLIKEIESCIYLYIDDSNGITWIEDGRTNYSKVYELHENSQDGYKMIEQRYWKNDSILIKGNDLKHYNLSTNIYDWKTTEGYYDNLDMYQIVNDTCQCKECQARRVKK